MLDTVVAPKAWILLLMKLTRNQKFEPAKNTVENVVQIGPEEDRHSKPCSARLVGIMKMCVLLSPKKCWIPNYF